MGMGRPHRCGGAGGSSARHAEEVGIYIDEWAVDPQHRFARPTGSVGRICHRPRIGASPRPESREGVQEFHVRLPTRLGRATAPPTDLVRCLEIEFHVKRKCSAQRETEFFLQNSVFVSCIEAYHPSFHSSLLPIFPHPASKPPPNVLPNRALAKKIIAFFLTEMSTQIKLFPS